MGARETQTMEIDGEIDNGRETFAAVDYMERLEDKKELTQTARQPDRQRDRLILIDFTLFLYFPNSTAEGSRFYMT